MHPTDLDLSDYADEGLTLAHRATIEEHLERCRDCRGLVADLREVHHVAAGLEPVEPPARAWRRLEIATRQSPAVASHRSPVTSHQSPVPRDRRRLMAGDGRPTTGDWRPTTGDWRLMTIGAAAALILALAVGFRMGYVAKRGAAVPIVSEAAPTEQVVEAELLQAEQHYEKAISGLEQIANAGTGALDPQTAATLQKGLAVVDQAIDDSRVALKTQPGSEPAEQSLLDNFKTKIGLLQDTVALINDMRRDQQAGAARIVSGLEHRP